MVLERVREYIERTSLFSPGARVVVGLSGGADSVCLLEALRLLAPQLRLSLFAIHIHHNIRGAEADEDRAFAESFCAKRGIPFRCICRDIPKEAAGRGLGLEEAGRLARREEFERALAALPADVIALAHHKNDLAETMLFQLARGSGLRGLLGISPRSGPYVRPLLCLTRAEIETFLRERGLSFREDATNADPAYSRNRIRHEILPALLKNVNPHAVEHMAEASAELLETRDYLESLLPGKWSRCAVEFPCGRDANVSRINGMSSCRRDAVENVEKGTAAVLLLAGQMQAEPAIFQRMLVREAFRRLGGLKDIGRVHVAAVLDLLEGAVGRRRNLPGILASRTEEGVLLALVRRRALDGGSEGTEDTRLATGKEGVYCAGKDGEGQAGGRHFSHKDGEGQAGGTNVPLNIPGETCFGGWLFTAELHPGPAASPFTPVSGSGCLPAGQNPAMPQIRPGTENHYTKAFDYDIINDKLNLRFREKGDYLVIHPDGRKKTLSNLFTDRKIPKGERDGIVLLAAAREVLWALGVRGGESARVGVDTRTVLLLRAARYGNWEE